MKQVPKRLPSGGIKYRGKEFSGINIPRASSRKGKAQMVIAQKGRELKVVHFGTDSNSLPENESKVKAGRKGYLSRSKQLRAKDGTLTKKDKFSANYWSSQESNG